MRHKFRRPGIAAFAATRTGKNQRSHPVGEEPGLNTGVGAADGRNVKALDHKHLTYSGFATIAVAVSLLLAAPAHAVQLPDGQNTLADTARAAGETLTATGGHTPSGGGESGVGGGDDQGRGVQQKP